VSAIKKYLGAKDELFVNGEKVKASDLAQMYQDALDTRATAVTVKGDYKSALAARDEAEATRVSADVALQPYVLQRFGANSSAAHDFGFTPRKSPDKTVVSKARAVLLGQATRVARGTTSKKKQQQIKGTLSPEAAAALEALSASSSGGGASSGTAAAPSPVTSAAAAPAVASTPAVAAAATNGTPLNGSAHS
jgi:hypothetical protein